MNETVSIHRLPSTTWAPAQTGLSWFVSPHKEHHCSRLRKFLSTRGRLLAKWCVICIFEKYHICSASISKLAGCNYWICTEQLCFPALRTPWACCNHQHRGSLWEPEHQLYVRSLQKILWQATVKARREPQPAWGPREIIQVHGISWLPFQTTHKLPTPLPGALPGGGIIHEWSSEPILPTMQILDYSRPGPGCTSEPTFFSVF